MEQRPLAERVAAVTALDEPIRRALYAHVSRSELPVGRDDAAEALGLARSTAAFHLDRLADEGLLAVEYKRLTGRTGPGSGRPAKLYRRAAGEVAVTLPERHYELVGQLLLEAIEESTRTREPVADALLRIAGETGRILGSSAGSLEQFLEDYGYEPRSDGEGGIVLGNCPFHRLARQHTDVVCNVNLQLLRGAAEESRDPQQITLLDPGDGRCCVRALPQLQPPASEEPGE